MKNIRCELSFQMPDTVTKKDVETFLYKHLAGQHVKNSNAKNEEIVEDALFHSDSFEVDSVTAEED